MSRPHPCLEGILENPVSSHGVPSGEGQVWVLYLYSACSTKGSHLVVHQGSSGISQWDRGTSTSCQADPAPEEQEQEVRGPKPLVCVRWQCGYPHQCVSPQRLL